MRENEKIRLISVISKDKALDIIVGIDRND